MLIQLFHVADRVNPSVDAVWPIDYIFVGNLLCDDHDLRFSRISMWDVVGTWLAESINKQAIHCQFVCPQVRRHLQRNDVVVTPDGKFYNLQVDQWFRVFKPTYSPQQDCDHVPTLSCG